MATYIFAQFWHRPLRAAGVMGGVAAISSRFAGVAGLVGLIGGGLLAWVSLAGLVAERRRKIGLMKAVGWRSRDVTRVFMGEFLLLGLLGIALGLGAAALLGYLPLPAGVAPETLPGLAAIEPPSQPERLAVTVSFETLALALLLAGGGALLAGWRAVRPAARLKPAQTLSEG